MGEEEPDVTHLQFGLRCIGQYIMYRNNKYCNAQCHNTPKNFGYQHFKLLMF
jgi:hypothetical protein